ncbi:HAD family hydrolase [Archangium lansingense]|uniref:HAD family hydrolase n=1 Tax=Archangium lansingense TaxID=2995310 RepID=A0ABT4AKE5_9BACT|nr:HAD family hydrolase [Archangium lansinium]MCY1082168.1 HAD family hydrolase [Archangium lansinium]
MRTSPALRTAREVVLPLLCLTALAASSPSPAQAPATREDPLPSWNEGAPKKAILDFVKRVTTPGSPDFIPVEERIATFDNDGTLWPEQPVIQGAFVLAQLQKRVAKEPSLKQKPAVKAALDGDLEYLTRAGEKALMELFAITSANLTDEQFDQEVREFFQTAKHPKLGVPYTQLAYQPMVELLEYLRANGFRTYISSGGGIDFMRAISQQMYGIPPEQVIGSSLKKEFKDQGGKSVLWRKPEPGAVNDKETKPVNIDLHIGRRPVLAAGNERSSGDIAMLEYSQGREGPSLQLLVNHDDAQREFSYQEKDNASLNAAKAHGWTVVSIKNDWKTVFKQ